MDRFEKHFEQVDGIIRHEFVDFIKVNLGSLMCMSCINFIDKGKIFVTLETKSEIQQRENR